MAPYVPYAPPLPKPTKFIQYYFIEWLLVVKPHLSINPPFPRPVWLLVVTVPTINSSDCSASVHTYLISLEISDHTYSAVGTFIALGAHNQKKNQPIEHFPVCMYVCMSRTHISVEFPSNMIHTDQTLIIPRFGHIGSLGAS